MKSPIRTLVLIAVIILLFVVIYATFLLKVSNEGEVFSIQDAGMFGDSFGILTSLFSGLAFAGIIVTVWMQHHELSLQRNELELTRQEFADTRREMELQHATAKQQNFENTFFQMLRLHNSILESIDLTKRTSNTVASITGRDCFETFYFQLRKSYNSEKKHNAEDSEIKIIELAYERFWSVFQKELGHYFRYLYNIFRFIKYHDFIDQKFYSNIVRAQLSDQELLILFYNCLCKHGVEKFKPIVEDYQLFDNLPRNLLFDEDHANLYREAAFSGD